MTNPTAPEPSNQEQPSRFTAWRRRHAEERRAKTAAYKAERAAKKAADNEALSAKMTAHREKMNRSAELKTWVQERTRERVATCQGVHLFPDRIVRLPTGWLDDNAAESFPLTGVSAAVDSAGGIASRGTLARSVALGGWQKKTDTREVWLVVDGPEFQWIIPLQPGLTSAARKFAAQVTTLGRRAS